MSSFTEYQKTQIIKETKISNKENESKEDFKNTHEKYSILSILMSNNESKDILQTNSNSYNSMKKYSCDVFAIKKYDECNKSFSNISSFDLDCQEEKDFNSSFNSLENSFEENYEKNEEITISLKNKNDLEEAKYLFELNKEYEEIEKEILNIKN